MISLGVLPTMNATIIPILADTSGQWPSAVVAVALILFLAVVMIIALLRYTMDEVLKLWAALGTIVGIVFGAFGTYFFTREATQAKVQAAQAQTQAARTEVRLAENSLNTLKEASQAIKTKLPREDAEWFEMIYKGTGAATPKPRGEQPTKRSCLGVGRNRRARAVLVFPALDDCGLDLRGESV
jgi:hypothetical protein